MANLSDIKMAKMCALVKQELGQYDRDSRSQILYKSMNWALTRVSQDPSAHGVYQWLQEAYQASQHGSRSDFLHNPVWATFGNHWGSQTMRAVVASILDDNVYSDEDTDDEDTDEEDTDDSEGGQEEGEDEEDAYLPRK